MNMLEYYESRKKLVDEAVLKFLESEKLTDFETPKGGKRLRGVLVLLVCEALGCNVNEALDGAVAVELAHAASLDVDDIVDLDILRRGKPAEWVRKGITKVALGSHALVASSMKIVEKYGSEALSIFVDTYGRMVRGEIMDLKLESLYESVIAAKTASLYAAAATLGALIARRSDLRNLAYNYGLYTGIAFQIADDIVDTYEIVEEFNIRKLLEPSTLLFMGYLGLESLIRNPLKLITHGLSSIKDVVKDVAMKKLEERIRTAQSFAYQFPESQYKPLLIQYPELAVEFMLKEGGVK